MKLGGGRKGYTILKKQWLNGNGLPMIHVHTPYTVHVHVHVNLHTHCINMYIHMYMYMYIIMFIADHVTYSQSRTHTWKAVM